MVFSLKRIASLNIILILALSTGLFTPNLVHESEILDQLMYGAIAREHEANFISRYMWFYIFFSSVILFAYGKDRLRQFSLYSITPILILLFYVFITCFWSGDLTRSLTQFMKHTFIFVSLLSIALHLDIDDLVSKFHPIFCTVALVGLCFIPFDSAWSEIGYKSIHGHKNTAGMIYSAGLIFYIVKLYNARNLQSIFFILIFSFLLFASQSKTSMALSILICSSFYLFRRFMIDFRYIGLFTILLFFIFFISLFNLHQLNSAGYTFTGRTVIWDFILDEIEQSVWFGSGFSGYWDLGEDGRYFMYGEYYDEFIRNLNQSHNSYLDLILGTGIIGLTLFIILLISLFNNIQSRFRNASFGYVYLSSISVFCVFHSFMESTVLRGDNIVWIIFVVSSIAYSRKVVNENSITSFR